jgi:hypothetical protein
MTDQPTPVLEQAAQDFADATATPPFLYDLGPVEGRKAVDDVQKGDGVERPDADIADLTIPGGPTGEVSIRIVKPAGTTGTLPALLHTHGAGWVFGNAHTHDRLIRELATRADAAVVFTNYDLSPEARHPTAIEQVYTALQWIGTNGLSDPTCTTPTPSSASAGAISSRRFSGADRFRLWQGGLVVAGEACGSGLDPRSRPSRRPWAHATSPHRERMTWRHPWVLDALLLLVVLVVGALVSLLEMTV